MGRADARSTLYRSGASIALSALVAAVFAFRAGLAASGASSLSGPAWATISALLAGAFVVRCFDRVVLTSGGVTIVRVGFPTRLVPGQIPELLLATSGSSTRLIAQETNGTMRLLASRRTDTDGERQLREFQERGRHLFAHHFGSLAATAADVDETSPIPTTRRCVRPACPAYRTAVTDEQCRSCGDRTQRVNSGHTTG